MAGENDLFYRAEGQKRPQEQTLAQVVSATFEKIGFMEARLTDESVDDPQNTITAFIEILTPIQGRMFLSAPQQLGWTIAENLYGLEDLTLEAVGDMMSELLNTITGSLLSAIMPDQQFNLAIPRICEGIPTNLDNAYIYHFNIDNNGIITIVLFDNNNGS